MSDEKVVEEVAPEGAEEQPEEGEEMVSLSDLSFSDLEALLPERVSLSLSNMGPGKWAAILRPVPGEAPRLITPGYVPPAKTPIMSAGPTLGAVISAVFAMMAPEGLRCPQCGEFSMEKLAEVPGSSTWLECLTCQKRFPAGD